MKMCSAYKFIFMQIKLIFIWKVCTKTRFETEAEGNSIVPLILQFWIYMLIKIRKNTNDYKLVATNDNSVVSFEKMLSLPRTSQYVAQQNSEINEIMLFQ